MFGFPGLDDPPSVPRRRANRSLDDLASRPARRPPERDARSISRSAVRGRSEAFANARRRVQVDQVSAADELEIHRIPPISVVSAVRRAKPLKAIAAKASAADRRFYHPEWPYAPPVTSYGTPARFGVAALSLHQQFRDAMKFYKSLSVVPCVQRAARREVLFATGQHGAHHSKRKKGPFSNMRC